jgi:uncharacterized protein RhaS with RHS repeats
VASGVFGGYDALLLDNNPYKTLYAYDALGNLIRVDQKGSPPGDSTQWRTRTFTYDSFSRLLTATCAPQKFGPNGRRAGSQFPRCLKMRGGSHRQV